APADTVAIPNRPAAVAVDDRVARAVLRPAMPGILGVVDPHLSLADRVALARAIAARLRVGERLTAIVEPAVAAPAVLGRVDLGTAGGTVASADGRVRLVWHGALADAGRGAPGLLDGYLERGEAALRGLSGSFALALWDARLGRLHLANDRFGLR